MRDGGFDSSTCVEFTVGSSLFAKGTAEDVEAVGVAVEAIAVALLGSSLKVAAVPEEPPPTGEGPPAPPIACATAGAAGKARAASLEGRAAYQAAIMSFSDVTVAGSLVGEADEPPPTAEAASSPLESASFNT